VHWQDILECIHRQVILLISLQITLSQLKEHFKKNNLLKIIRSVIILRNVNKVIV
jgi:hypothetical protein